MTGILGLLDLLEDRLPARLHHRGQDDGVHALVHETVQRLDSVFLLPLGVGEFEKYAAFFRLGADRLGLGDAPAALCADLRETDRVGFLARASRRSAPVTSGHDRGEEDQQARHQQATECGHRSFP